MQGWRISMEDAHAAVLDLQIETEKEFKAAGIEDRVSFFGVYDGHGGDKVAHFAGEHIHKILTKQDAFKNKDFEEALKAGFLATDRAILSGMSSIGVHQCPIRWTKVSIRSEVRRRGLWLYSICWSYITYHNLRGKHWRQFFDHQPADGLKANAGDSRSVLGIKGEAKPLSFDHKPQNEGQ